MRVRLLPGLILVALALVPVPSRGADSKATRPVVVLRFASIDGILADMRYVLELAGQEEKARQAEEAIKTQLGPKGLEGIDTKKPFGAYLAMKEGLESTQAFVLVPIADAKAFLGLLGRANLNLKEKDGVHTGSLEVNNNLTVHVNLRFANKYAHIKLTRDTATLEKAELYDPSVLLPVRGDLIGFTLNADQIPEDLKKTATSIVSVFLGTVKSNKPRGETEAQTRLREAVLDEVGGTIQSLVTESNTVHVGLNIDREARDLSFSFSLTGVPDSDLAKRIAALAQRPSLGASLAGPDSAVNFMLNLELPAPLRRPAEPFIDESIKTLLSREKVRDKREVLEVILQALAPTLKSGAFDGGFDLRGPSADGLYTFLGGVRVKDGAAIDKAFRKLVAKLPEKDRKSVKLDVDSAGDVTIHQITPDHKDAETKRLVGDGPMYVAVRSDALLIAGGENGLKALKEGIALEPKKGDLGHVDVSMSRLAGLAPRDQQEAARTAARKAFTEKGSDRIRIALDGGKSLRLRASMKASVVTFFSLMDKAKNGE